MQYAISDIARYIKNIIPPTIPETYSIIAMFDHVSGEENIRRNGVLAFRDLLYLVCDRLIDDGSLYDKSSKSTQVCDFHPSLSIRYPFLNNVKSILFNIGYHGKLIENDEVILIDDIKVLTSVINQEGRQVKEKISSPKLIQALKFLTYCGFNFEGVDLNGRKLDLLKIASLKVSYPDNPVMLIGLKVMAIAQKELNSKGNHNIFLRCNYRVLKEEETESTSILKDFVAPLPEVVQDFALKLHKRYLDAGLTCRVDVFYLTFRFIYSHKGKEIWTFSASLDSGYRIIINAQNTDLYSDVVHTFPLFIQDKISQGFGCNKRLFGEPCQIGCHGFSFSLDDSIIDISRDIEVWLDKEVSCLQWKKDFEQ